MRHDSFLGKYFTALTVLIVTVSLSLGGCEPLRKKFIRQKKKDQDTGASLIPILEPIDYPAQIHTVEGDYKHRYSLWQVWFREFLSGLEDSASLKHQTTNLSQIIAQLEEMSKLLSAKKQSKLSVVIGEFQSLDAALKDASALTNTISIKLKAESLGKQMREQFRFNQVQSELAARGGAEK